MGLLLAHFKAKVAASVFLAAMWLCLQGYKGSTQVFVNSPPIQNPILNCTYPTFIFFTLLQKYLKIYCEWWEGMRAHYGLNKKLHYYYYYFGNERAQNIVIHSCAHHMIDALPYAEEPTYKAYQSFQQFL